MSIVGYEFKIRHPDGSAEWTQLHGFGGALGNGALHVQDGRKVRRITQALLERARRELSRNGIVHRSNDARHHEPLTITPITPSAVEACRAIKERKTVTTYTTTGDVRGTCGHKHKTLNTAARCLRRDQDGCRQQGGYSDRAIARADGAPLRDDELTELGRILGLDVLECAR